MRLDRLDAEREAERDLLRVEPLRDELQHLALPGRQLLERVLDLGVRRGCEGRDGVAERSFAPRDGADRLLELAGRGVLREVAAGSGAQRALDVRFARVHG